MRPMPLAWCGLILSAAHAEDLRVRHVNEGLDPEFDTPLTADDYTPGCDQLDGPVGSGGDAAARAPVP